MSHTVFKTAPDLSTDDYCVFGLAVCFLKEDMEIKQVEVIEPIPSAALEAIIKGIPTSYKIACAKSVGQVYQQGSLIIPQEFPETSQFCDQFEERVIAACRTYKIRETAQQHIPLNTIREDFNFSLEKKRILNAVNVVTTDDNVKQHSHTHKIL